MKQCTDLERKFLDFIIGKPTMMKEEDNKTYFKLVNKIRLGEDEERKSL
jgi:hypothetical protein